MKVSEMRLPDLALAELPLQQAKNPIALRDELRAACLRAVLAEFNPVGLAETMLARDIARRWAQMLSDEQRRDAVEIEVAHSLASVLLPAGGGGTSPDSIVANTGLFAQGRLEALARGDLNNSKAFFSRLQQLLELQRGRDAERSTVYVRDKRFHSDLQCLTYLARRFRLGDRGCRRCGQTGVGSWIDVRRCWQCAACNTQTCHRHGTVMARSHVALPCWFHAIEIALYRPSISASDLAAGIGLRRVPTARTMLRKIRAAMLVDNTSQLLAGLDAIFLSVN